jgi:hypothetical protein
MAYGHARFEARLAAQGGTTTVALHQANETPRQQENKQPKQEGITGWPAARWQNEARQVPRVVDRRSR